MSLFTVVSLQTSIVGKQPTTANISHLWGNWMIVFTSLLILACSLSKMYFISKVGLVFSDAGHFFSYMQSWIRVRMLKNYNLNQIKKSINKLYKSKQDVNK